MKRTRISTRVEVRKFDTEYTEMILKERFERALKEAAVLFVQTAAKNVPSLTGQAKAALINLAESLGLATGVDPFDPPISEHIHLYEYMVAWGNTDLRGYTLSSAQININRKSVSWTTSLVITAAHNDFPYFTYWDNQRWHSLDQASASARDFIRRSLQGVKTPFRIV